MNCFVWRLKSCKLTLDHTAKQCAQTESNVCEVKYSNTNRNVHQAFVVSIVLFHWASSLVCIISIFWFGSFLLLLFSFILHWITKLFHSFSFCTTISNKLINKKNDYIKSVDSLVSKTLFYVAVYSMIKTNKNTCLSGD